jgi:uncharacterized protein (TIGR02569 family)
MVDSEPRASEHLEANRADPERADPERADPERAGPERAGPERAGPERAGPERAGPERAGPERADPEHADAEAASPKPAGVPERVLAAFGLADVTPVPLAGGRGTAWLAGPVVLKPADLEPADRWNADVYDRLAGPGFRVPRPVRATSGDWIADGWTAWQRVSGAPADWSGVSPRWPELINGSRALHAALAPVEVPRWRVTQDIPWTAGDQVAWGERDPEPVLGPAAGSIGGQVRRLLAALRPVDLPHQLVHADLSGNVLFADGEPPAFIDFSPLRRPAALPLAVVAVDALQWHQARPEALDLLADEPEFDQLLARALIYRLVTDVILRAGTPGVELAGRAGQPVTELVLARLGSGGRR